MHEPTRSRRLSMSSLTPDAEWVPALPGDGRRRATTGDARASRRISRATATRVECVSRGRVEEYRDLGDRGARISVGCKGTRKRQRCPGRLQPVGLVIDASRRQGSRASDGYPRSRRGLAGGGPVRVAVRCRCPVSGRGRRNDRHECFRRAKRTRVGKLVASHNCCK